MNFGAHICVAARSSYGGDSGLVGLGSALPDLAAIGRFRLRGPVYRGPSCNGCFNPLQDRRPIPQPRAVQALAAPRRIGPRGSASHPRGAARAVAHVGPELIIDSVLLASGVNRDVVQRAFDSIEGVSDSLRPMVNEPDCQSWVEHLSAVAGWPTLETLGDSTRIAERMHRILDRRPRLAFDDGALPAVAAALDTVTASIEAEAEALTTHLATRT